MLAAPMHYIACMQVVHQQPVAGLALERGSYYAYTAPEPLPDAVKVLQGLLPPASSTCAADPLAIQNLARYLASHEDYNAMLQPDPSQVSLAACCNNQHAPGCAQPASKFTA
jgi:hypothetical protein